MQPAELPHESDNRRDTLERFANDFRFANELLNISIDAANAYCQNQVSNYELRSKIVVGGILAREIRRFRSISLVAEPSLIESAELLSRTMFEGVLAERFILMSPIPLDECSQSLRKARKRLPAIPADRHRDEFHADLYAALPTLKLKKMDQPEGLDEQQRLLSENALFDVEHSIGQDWLKVLTKWPFTYSGLTIAQLAENYGLQQFHKEIYRIQCGSVHANDALQFVDGGVGGDSAIIYLMLATKDSYLKQLPLVLRVTAGMFFWLVRDIDKAFSMGLNDRLTDFSDRYSAFVRENQNAKI